MRTLTIEERRALWNTSDQMGCEHCRHWSTGSPGDYEGFCLLHNTPKFSDDFCPIASLDDLGDNRDK